MKYKFKINERVILKGNDNKRSAATVAARFRVAGKASVYFLMMDQSAHNPFHNAPISSATATEEVLESETPATEQVAN